MSDGSGGRGRRDDAADSAQFVERIKQTADKLLRDRADRGDIKLLARALGELRYSFKILSRYRTRRKVTVFGSARTRPESPVYQLAVGFGKAMHDAGYMVITGAGGGIMEAAHVGAGPDMSIGFNIVLPFEQQANAVMEGDEKLIHFNYFFTRKLLFLKEADALVLFPGGFGTFDEGFEVLTMLQTGKSRMIPIVMIDVPGGDYWERWHEYIDRCLLQEGMISPEDLSLYRITHSIDEAVDEITGFYRVYHSQRYVRGKMMLRLQRPIGDELFDRIRAEYADILASGEFVRTVAHSDESNEPGVAHLPRLTFPFDRRSLGRLRQLIDLINKEG